MAAESSQNGVELLLEKFRQNEERKAKLLATRPNILAECAVQDRI